MKRQYHPLRLLSVIIAFFAGLSITFGEPAKPTSAQTSSTPQAAKPAMDTKVVATPADNVVLAPVAVTMPDQDNHLILAYTHLTAPAAVAKFNSADVNWQGKRLPAGFSYSLADQSVTQTLLKSRATEVADNSKMVQTGRSRLEYVAVKRLPVPTKTAATAAPPKPGGQ